MDTTKTGSYLAALRKDAGMTQQETADRLGVSNKTISKWESGGGFPDIAILPALAELYGKPEGLLEVGAVVQRVLRDLNLYVCRGVRNHRISSGIISDNE